MNGTSTVVLIVEDDEPSFIYLESLIRHTQAAIVRAYNGQEAVSIISENQDISIVLMDLKMPVMDGYSATPILKNTPATARIPVLALTASAMKDDNEKTMAVGFDGVLYKPVSRTVLLKELLRFLSHTFDTTIASDTVLTENTLQSSIGSASRGAEALQHSHHPSFMNGRSVLSEEVCVRLPELLAILEGEYGKQWQSVRNSLVMKKIEKFASGVVSLSEEYHVPELKEFGELLLRHKQYYELDAIPTTMERFPGIVEQIREHIRHHRDQV